MGLCVEAQMVTSRGADSSAHLGGSSNYKSGEPFGLMWRRFSCRLCLGMSDPVLREWRKSGHEGKTFFGSPRLSKGMLVNIPATYAALRGRLGQKPSSFAVLPRRYCNIAATQRVLGDACERDGECQLFLLTALWVP